LDQAHTLTMQVEAKAKQIGERQGLPVTAGAVALVTSALLKNERKARTCMPDINVKVGLRSLLKLWHKPR